MFIVIETNKPRRNEEIEYGLDRESSDEDIESHRMLIDDDFEYNYVTDEDLSCHSDDDQHFEHDSSQKNLLQERSINALINDVNQITPGGVMGVTATTKLDSKRDRLNNESLSSKENNPSSKDGRMDRNNFS
jgi:hypothetical protein